MYSYLLLELMIALTLVMLCVLPFVNIPTKAMHKELHAIKRLELQHIADATFALIKEQIYTQKISWEQICLPKEKKALILDDLVSFSPQGLKNQQVARKCYLYSKKKIDRENRENCLVTIEVHLDAAVITYKFCLASSSTTP